MRHTDFTVLFLEDEHQVDTHAYAHANECIFIPICEFKKKVRMHILGLRCVISGNESL